MITAQHFYKTKRTELKFGKDKAFVINKKLTAPGTFPLVLQGTDVPWKLHLDYDQERKAFILYINDVAFLELPY